MNDYFIKHNVTIVEEYWNALYVELAATLQRNQMLSILRGLSRPVIRDESGSSHRCPIDISTIGRRASALMQVGLVHTSTCEVQQYQSPEI
jgi:hypothetical protein